VICCWVSRSRKNRSEPRSSLPKKEENFKKGEREREKGEKGETEKQPERDGEEEGNE